MQELLTGKRRLPGFHGHWERRALAEVVIDLVAGVSVNSTDDEPVAGTPCVLKTSALSGGSLLSHECKPITPADYPRARTSLRGNTILISRMNTPDLVGEISYVPEDIPWIFLPDRVWMARLDPSVNARWLANVLTNSACRQRVRDAATGTSGSMKNISKGALLALEIPFPSLAEQTAIATLLSDLDAELEALESQLAKARDLKQGMMQALLTGRIRLV
jgi:hypothetical protein